MNFTSISHFSFTKIRFANICKMLNDKLMKSVKCEMKNTYQGGSRV